MSTKNDYIVPKYTSQEIYELGVKHIKRKEREEYPWTVEFWRAKPMLGYWLIIMALIVITFILGVLGCLNF
jgi:hypothetical protein